METVNRRRAGVILPVTSLPSPYGVGTLGAAAYNFIDFLQAAGQRVWQVLPLGPTGFGDSPYQCLSSFAGNPWLIDLDLLAADGLLTAGELPAADGDPAGVDYGRLYATRPALLKKAFARFRPDADFRAFCRTQEPWLADYCRFAVMKERFGGKPWPEWPEPFRRRETRAATAQNGREPGGELLYHSFIQYEFFRQWNALRAYAKARGVSILGDVPFYVPLDSADVWANSRQFQLDGAGLPVAVAGVPPDYFSENGQLWGNPLYDWELMRQDGFAFCLSRLRMAARLFDAVRLDHFRGFESYWAVPAAQTTARNGVWRRGPGLAFLRAVKAACPDTAFLAEDLGLLTPAVRALRELSGFPGMRVLQFAFEPGGGSDYLPGKLDADCVCYTGTHDNPPLFAWLREAPQAELDFAARYLSAPKEKLGEAILQAGMDSAATLFMAQMQDWLRLGPEARMNRPGVCGGENWRWRLLPDACGGALAARMRTAAQRAGRL